MKKKVLIISLMTLILFPIISISADTGAGNTSWGAWRKTQSSYGSLVEHSTDVQCKDATGRCQAGSRTFTDNAGLPAYQTTSTTAWTYGYLRVRPNQKHYHDYYGGWIY